MYQTLAAWVKMNFDKVRYSVYATLRLTQSLYLLWDIIGLAFQALSSAQQDRLCVRFEEYFLYFNFKTFDFDFPQYCITETPKFRRRPLIVNPALAVYHTLEFWRTFISPPNLTGDRGSHIIYSNLSNTSSYEY
jgi:hypothetical protein